MFFNQLKPNLPKNNKKKLVYLNLKIVKYVFASKMKTFLQDIGRYFWQLRF